MRRMRILHVAGEMSRGGTETWLLHVLKHIDRTRFQMDFLVHTSTACAYDEAIRRLGSNIIPCLHPKRPWEYAGRFVGILKKLGPYDVIHSHVHYFSGWILKLAYHARVPTRVVHSHSDTSLVDKNAGIFRRIYLRRMRSWIDKYATSGIAASSKAAVALYGPQWRTDPRWRILHCAIDLEPFRRSANRTKLRAELGIPERAWIIGHVGTFSQPKNHAFLVRIAADLIRVLPNAFVLLVGDGPLRSVIEAEVLRSGISERVIFCGTRDDVARLMLEAMDVFLFPSLWEGIPLGLIEAQAAGLPCIISDAISEESDVVPHLITRLSLGQSTSIWVEEILRRKGNPVPIRRAEATALVAKSTFNSETSARDMEKLYASL